MMSGGVGLLDYDGDGWLDIFCVQGGSLTHPGAPENTSRLYHNTGHGRFEDVTDRARIRTTGYGMGCACADYDGDGDPDIYITQIGGNALLRNEGNGTFTDVTAQAGVRGGAWGTSAAFVDYDQDGALDLLIANYLHWSPQKEVECHSRGGIRDYCSPLSYQAPAMDSLYRNRGDATFEDVTRSAGLDRAFGNGLGVATGDFNQDGRIDLFVANDAMPNQLWINQGNGRFVDEAILRGCAVNAMGMTRAGMGAVAVDLLQRGQLDLFVTHLVGEGNGLFLNRNGFFTDHIAPRGPGAPSRNLTGFGVGFADFDHDGHLDLYVANGRVKFGLTELDPRDPYAEPNTLLRGRGRGEFEEILPVGGLSQPRLATSRGLALGDLDNDGDIDVVITSRDGPAQLLRNRASNGRSWIQFRVLNRRGAYAYNARVRIQSGGVVLWRQVQPHEGYCSSHDPRIHVGLGTATRLENADVHWPDGTLERFGPFDANQSLTLRQGQGQTQ